MNGGTGSTNPILAGQSNDLTALLNMLTGFASPVSPSGVAPQGPAVPRPLASAPLAGTSQMDPLWKEGMTMEQYKQASIDRQNKYTADMNAQAAAKNAAIDRLPYSWTLGARGSGGGLTATFIPQGTVPPGVPVVPPSSPGTWTSLTTEPAAMVPGSWLEQDYRSRHPLGGTPAQPTVVPPPPETFALEDQRRRQALGVPAVVSPSPSSVTPNKRLWNWPRSFVMRNPNPLAQPRGFLR